MLMRGRACSLGVKDLATSIATYELLLNEL